MKNFSEFTKKEQKDICEQSGYTMEDMKYNDELFIEDGEMEDYAQQLAEDTGTITGTEQWPLNCIDWEYATKELLYDYSEVVIDDVTYYFRAW